MNVAFQDNLFRNFQKAIQFDPDSFFVKDQNYI